MYDGAQKSKQHDAALLRRDATGKLVQVQQARIAMHTSAHLSLILPRSRIARLQIVREAGRTPCSCEVHLGELQGFVYHVDG